MEVEKILQSYSVFPLNIENITTHLWKVSDGNRAYALKESKLSLNAIKNWEKVFRLAEYHQLSVVMPVYMAQNGQLYQESFGKFYYLTPWVDHDANRNTTREVADFYKSIGMVHGKTKQSRQIDKEDFVREFDTYKQACATLFNELTRSISRFERMHYMSPFELSVCSQFRDTEMVFQVLQKRLDQLVYVHEEEQLTWSNSLCHGQLSDEHTMHHNSTKLINWEQARYENATMDLVRYFKAETLHYDAPTSSFTEQFDSYIKENELSEKELQLLTIHILHPFSYCRLVQEYLEDPTAKTMMGWTSQLQRAYRQLIFGLHWSEYVEKEHETITFEDLES